MTIKALTNVRTDNFFLALWVQYYGALFGRENLHIMLDGDDWAPDCDLTGVHLHTVTDVPRERHLRLGYTARWQSRHATSLLRRGADVVLRTDIDEFVAIDPRAGTDLHGALTRQPAGTAWSALGVDVIQAPDEPALDPATPILQQRRHAVVTREFSKLVAIRKPVPWAGGFHRARHTAITLPPDLLLFHLALFDRDVAANRVNARKTTAEHATQADHIASRLNRFAEVTSTPPLPFDAIADKARQLISTPVPSKSGPHPGIIPDGNVARGYLVHLPDRLANCLPAVPAALIATLPPAQ
jgi:hypothetical protein